MIYFNLKTDDLWSLYLEKINLDNVGLCLSLVDKCINDQWIKREDEERIY